MNMFPHTVTVYNSFEDPVTFKPSNDITILRGVLLDESKGANVRMSGLESADAANLYVPFSVAAVDGISLLNKRYVPPNEYDRLMRQHKGSDVWTFRDGKSYFVSGEVVEPDKDLNYIEANYGAYLVTKVDTKNFGSEDMQHWEVGGK